MAHGRSIHPGDARSVAAHDRLVRYCIYEIVEKHPPPRVDLAKTLKHSLLPAAFVPRFTRWQIRYIKLAGASFVLCQFVSVAILFVRAPLGRLLAVVSFLMQLPLLVLGCSTLCTDIIRQLMKTFEFWFFTFANTSAVVVMAMYFNDLRALYLLPVWLGAQYNICLDAAVRDSRLALGSITMGILYNTVAIVMIALGAIDSTMTFTVVDYGLQTLDGDDFLMNTISTVVYMSARSIYRRLTMMRAQDHHGTPAQPGTNPPARRVRCTVYRCAVKLRRLKRTALDEGEVAPLPRLVGPIQFVQLDRHFDSRETLLCGRNLTTIRIPLWQQILFHAAGGVGLSLTGLMFLVLNYVPNVPLVARLFAMASPILTVSYCCVCISLYHPGLLSTLCWTVDFAFMAAQFLFAHVCAAFLFRWDDRAFVLLSSFFWVMFMLTVDAFTPVAREKIGFRVIYLVPLLLLSITAHIMIANEVTRPNSVWRMQDYTILHLHALGHEFRLNVMPAFFNRVWMLVFWELRALWRILKASKNDLVMIHGAIDLDASNLRRGRRPMGAGPVRVLLPDSAVTGTSLNDPSSAASGGG